MFRPGVAPICMRRRHVDHWDSRYCPGALQAFVIFLSHIRRNFSPSDELVSRTPMI